MRQPHLWQNQTGFAIREKDARLMFMKKLLVLFALFLFILF